MDAIEYKKAVAATFDDVSARYDENKFFAISARRMVELVPYSESMEILDVSTGTGLVAIELARKYPHAFIEAIDLSPGMLDQAKQKARGEGHENITFKQCDVENIAYGDRVFDIVTCGYALFFYPDMETTYQSICSLIKPGGMLLFSTFTQEAFNPFAELFLKRLEVDYQIEVPSRLRGRLKTQQQIEELASVSVHKQAKVEHFPIRYPIKLDDWWSLLNNAGYKSLIDQLGAEQLAQFKRAHLSEIAAISVDGVIDFNADSLFCSVSV